MTAARIGFSRSNSKAAVLSILIRKILGVEFSHVYLGFHSNRANRDLIYQANSHGVYFIGEKQFLMHNLIVDEFETEISEETFNKVLTFCIDESGKSYGFWNLLGVGIKTMLQKLSISVPNFLSDGNKTYICSELIAQIYNDLEKADIDPNTTTPSDLYEIIKKDLDFKRVTNG